MNAPTKYKFAIRLHRKNTYFSSFKFWQGDISVNPFRSSAALVRGVPTLFILAKVLPKNIARST